MNIGKLPRYIPNPNEAPVPHKILTKWCKEMRKPLGRSYTAPLSDFYYGFKLYDYYPKEISCPKCHGDGYTDDNQMCMRCFGSGRTTKTYRVEIVVEPGTPPGQRYVYHNGKVSKGPIALTSLDDCEMRLDASYVDNPAIYYGIPVLLNSDNIYVKYKINPCQFTSLKYFLIHLFDIPIIIKYENAVDPLHVYYIRFKFNKYSTKTYITFDLNESWPLYESMYPISDVKEQYLMYTDNEWTPRTIDVAAMDRCWRCSRRAEVQTAERANEPDLPGIDL